MACRLARPEHADVMQAGGAIHPRRLASAGLPWLALPSRPGRQPRGGGGVARYHDYLAGRADLLTLFPGFRGQLVCAAVGQISFIVWSRLTRHCSRTRPSAPTRPRVTWLAAHPVCQLCLSWARGGGAGLDEGLGGPAACPGTPKVPCASHEHARRTGPGNGRPRVTCTPPRGKLAVWAAVLDELSLRGEEQVLDVGCGRGAVLSSGEGCRQKQPRSPRRGTPLAVMSIGGVTVPRFVLGWESRGRTTFRFSGLTWTAGQARALGHELM